MTWEQAHRRYAALREIEALADADPSGALPWSGEYAEVFGDREHLLVALRHRWRTLVECQLDPELGLDVLQRTQARLAAAHPGLLRVLALADERAAAPALERGLPGVRAA